MSIASFRRPFRRIVGTLLVAATCAGAACVQADEQSAARWWGHVEALANDGMEGRNTGSPGHERAARYVAAEFQKAGLEPAGIGGYMQPVKFKTRRIVEAQSSLALVNNGRVETLTLGVDANIGLRNDPASTVDAPLVFVGYGLDIPEQGINDLEGLDLKGAIVVFISATPESLPGPLRAHYGSGSERWKMYKAAGAIGTASIANPKSVEVPWARSTLARLQTAMSLADPSFDEVAGQQISISVNPAHADKLLAGSGHTFAGLVALVDSGKPVPRFVLPSRLKATVAVERAELESENVVGVLRGSDPKRRDEYVVISGHLDHVGIGGAVDGDTIYNGAMDNAAGIAAMIEVAQSLQDAGARPARSILFVAVTGEEKGLLGSNYFASHPTVPQSGIVANINTDMFLPLFPMKSVMVLGLDESDLGQDIRETAKALGVSVRADDAPQYYRFVRSDQYSFIKHGVPALAMQVGFEPGTPEAAISTKWMTERYHAPSDDLQQPIDRSAAGKYVVLVRDLALRIANRSTRPQWNASSFFKRFEKASGAAVDSDIEQRMQQGRLVGLGAAIVVNDEIVWMKGYGFADKERGLTFTPDTVMNIGSISKTFTGAALMRAVQEGKLSLDEDVNAYLPFKVVNPGFPNERITPRQLATHTSGITDRQDVYEATYHFGGAAPEALGPFLQGYLTQDGKNYSNDNFLKAKPGSQREYSNIGAGLAGYVVERAVGEPLDAYTRRHIFTPLGMVNSGWHLSEFAPATHARLYVVAQGLRIPIPYYAGTTYPDGGVRTSVSDLARFFVALLNGGEYNGTRILQKKWAEEMLRFQYTDASKPGNVQLRGEDAVNSGIFWATKFDATRIGHNGSDPGVRTIMLADPDREMGVILFTNTSVPDEDSAPFFEIFETVWKHAAKLKSERELAGSQRPG